MTNKRMTFNRNADANQFVLRLAVLYAITNETKDTFNFQLILSKFQVKQNKFKITFKEVLNIFVSFLFSHDMPSQAKSIVLSVSIHK